MVNKWHSTLFILLLLAGMAAGWWDQSSHRNRPPICSKIAAWNRRITARGTDADRSP